MDREKLIELNSINACIERLEARERKAMNAAQFLCGSVWLPRVHLRSELRSWFWGRKEYLWKELAKRG